VDETRKPRPRWRRFSLRILLVFVLLLCLPLSWLRVKLNEAREQREAVTRIEQRNGRVFAHCSVNADGSSVSMIGKRTPPATGTYWLRKWLGDDFFDSVAGVLFSRADIGDDDLPCLSRLTDLQVLMLHDTQISDVGLVHVQGLTNLEVLLLRNTRVTDAGLVHLAGLNKLKRLELHGTQVTDKGLDELRQTLPNCNIRR